MTHDPMQFLFPDTEPADEPHAASPTAHLLDELAAEHAAGRTPGVASICSAHPLVLDETVRHGASTGEVVLIEATCNQVNQDGGYTGLRPADFRHQVENMAEDHGLSREQLVLGGDHLGPNPWKHLPAETAMAKSEELVDEFHDLRRRRDLLRGGLGINPNNS